MDSRQSCPICKGAGRERCPLHSKPIVARARAVVSSGSFFGESPPSVFVGHFGYPRVRAGVLAPPIPGEDLDNPSKWFSERLGIPEVSEKRLSLLNMTFSSNIKKPALAREYFGEVALSVKPTEVEARAGKMRPGLSFDKYSSPMGPSASLEEFKVTKNPKIPSKVDSIVGEKGLPATGGISELFDYGFDVYYIQRLLSAGFLGREKKLVPTRWGITAADSIVSQKLISEIKDFPKLDHFLIFRSSHLDNEFHVLLLPTEWCFEQLEGYVPGKTVVQDWEFYGGRKGYASNVAGGYYAGRLAVCEYLREKGFQAGAIIVRSIGAGYFAPLGVWQVRENVRNALAKSPEEFHSFKDAFGKLLSETRVDSREIEKRSKLAAFLKSQRRLSSFSSV